MKESGEKARWICGHNKNEAWNKEAHTQKYKGNASYYYFVLSLFVSDKFVMNRKNFS